MMSAFFAKRGHFACKCFVKSGVELTEICHGRINDDTQLGIGMFEKINDMRNNTDLLKRAEISGVDRIKGQTLPLPLFDNRVDLIGQIAEGKAAEGGMV